MLFLLSGPSIRENITKSGEQAIEAVAQAIIAADDRQEPRIARIERMVGKIFGVEAAGVIRDAGDLARRLKAEIGHHRDPAAVAAETIMEIVALPHMRQRIECEGDI